MAKCESCKGQGCQGCGERGYISDCKAKEHWALIDGKRYDLVLDPGSRQHRFRVNQVVRDFMTAASEGRKFTLNDVARKVGAEEYTKNELLEFYLLIGYSMCGLSELDYFYKLKMDTCEWQKPAQEPAGKPIQSHACADACKKCEGCGTCLYVAGFKQDVEAANQGYPFFICQKCGKNNFWD